MIKRLSTAAIGVALIFSATSSAQAGKAYFGYDGRSYGEPVQALNWGRPEAKNVKPVKDDPAAPRKCLTKPVHDLLDKVEARFGPVRVISTCRPGARIAGSGRISRHASGNAVDFDAGSRKGAIINWLVANHKTGGTMTYPDMSHIHIDIGQHFVSLAGGRKYASNSGSSRRYSDSGSSRSSGRRYAEGYGRDYDGYSGSSRRYARETSYERGYSSYRGGGNSDYRNGYATIYR
jgi:uncharacterized protein YcbK (DUF882 family)